MLHSSAVSPPLLKLLRTMLAKPALAGFALAGGTSLALRFGHRASTDLDFFTTAPFDPDLLAEKLGFGVNHILGMARGTLQLRIQDIKVEFLRHAYPRIEPTDQHEGIPMWSLPDVSAMKLNAVANRGSKKDFHDLAVMMRRIPLETMIRHYQQKYQPASLFMVIRSLAWFDDADQEPDPIFLDGSTWNHVKQSISHAVRSLR